MDTLMISLCVISSVLSTLALGFSIWAGIHVIGQEKSTHRLIYGNGWQEVPQGDFVNNKENRPNMPEGKALADQIKQHMYPDEDHV